MEVHIVDKELKVMQRVVSLLQSLDDEERGRVVRWFSERFGERHSETTRRVDEESQGSKLGDSARNRSSPAQNDVTRVHVDGSSMQFGGDLLIRLQDEEVKTEGDKVLVVMKWFREVGGKDQFTAYEVNQELKKVGMRVGNITSAFSELIKKGMVVQVDKKGRYKQGRKRYRLSIRDGTG